MTVTAGDMPDWTTQTAPLVTSQSFTNQGAGQVLQLNQSANPYRIWGVWVQVSVTTIAGYAGGAQTWGAQVNDGSGIALLRAAIHVGAAGVNGEQSLSLAIPGFTPKFSAGFFTTNFVTDAGIVGLFTRASAGILFSQP